MTDQLKLGYIGLGNMGTPMAKKMIEWPGGLTVYDIQSRGDDTAGRTGRQPG